MMKCTDAEKLLYENDEEVLSGIHIPARQAEQLIGKFGIEITHAPAATYGSERYIKAVHALDKLSRAEVQLVQSGKAAVWEQTTIDGRKGSEIVRQLLPIKARLQEMGEGAPQPKAVASN